MIFYIKPYDPSWVAQRDSMFKPFVQDIMKVDNYETLQKQKKYNPIAVFERLVIIMITHSWKQPSQVEWPISSGEEGED